MNVLLLTPGELASAQAQSGSVSLRGRRLEHVTRVLRAAAGDTLSIGVVGGMLGSATILQLDDLRLDLRIDRLDLPPPDPVPLRLIIALPRPKVLNRIIASTTSLGVKRIDFINAWKVEKSYWKSPKIEEASIETQVMSGLEQGKDTIPPTIRFHRFFSRFLTGELPSITAGAASLLVAHPGAGGAPARPSGVTVLAVGPEGGFIEQEVESLVSHGFERISLGERILRTETAISYALGRLL